MPKQKKAQPMRIMIDLPDPDSKNGTATLVIVEGDKGWTTQFDYRGLTLHGNIAEAVKVARANLAGANLPFAKPTPESVDDTGAAETDETHAETGDDVRPTDGQPAPDTPTDNQQAALL